jgi:hypothetical protein
MVRYIARSCFPLSGGLPRLSAVLFVFVTMDP